MPLLRLLRWFTPSRSGRPVNQLSFNPYYQRCKTAGSNRLPENFFGTRQASSALTARGGAGLGDKKKSLARNVLKWKRYGVAAFVSGGIFVWDYYYNARTLSRNARTLWNGLLITIDYKLNYDPNNLEKMTNVHERAAARLLHVCKKNGGLYVKAGQAIGIQVAILPKPYHELAQLFDAAEPIPLEAVRDSIHQELGMWPEELFKEFDPVPLGSASIAQVHRAKLHTGEEVAVKVQRPDIRKHAKWDLLAFRTLMWIYERVFELPLTFASQYISDQIELETHFDNELRNTERVRCHVLEESPRHLRGGVAYVPKVYESLSTPRLLILEYIKGAVRMTDVKGMERLGLNPEKVMKSVCEVFAAQVFRWGFVNADPHPSNVLIRQHPKNPKTHQVVLIDHGLSIPLLPEFRYQYLTLWRALFTNNVEALKSVCKEWGINLGEGGFGAQMMGSAVLLQGWNQEDTKAQARLREHHHAIRRSRKRGGRFSKLWNREEEEEEGLTEEQKSELRAKREEEEKRDLEMQREMKATVKRFLENYELIPKELIFLGRSMRIIQANNQALNSPVDRISILAKGASDGLYDMTLHPPSFDATTPLSSNGRPVHRRSWLRRYIQANLDWFKLRLSIAGMNFAMTNLGTLYFVLWIQRAWLSVRSKLGLRTAEKGEGSDGGTINIMQQQVMDMAKEFGVEITEEAFRG